MKGSRRERSRRGSRFKRRSSCGPKLYRIPLYALAFLLCVGLSSAPGTEAERGPRAVCSARLAGDRVVATIELHSLLDDDLLSLIRLGMEGRIRVQASVVRKRWGLFEQDLAMQSSEARIGYLSDDRQYILNSRVRIRDPARFKVGRIALRVNDSETAAKRMTFRAEIRLQVVTESSLAKVAAWVTESSEEETSGSILARGLLSAVAEDLVRTTECSCVVERPERSNHSAR